METTDRTLAKLVIVAHGDEGAMMYTVAATESGLRALSELYRAAADGESPKPVRMPDPLSGTPCTWTALRLPEEEGQ